MNENIDLTKILKDCPKGTKLYSIIYGEVEFNRIEKECTFSIIFVTKDGNESTVTSDGKHYKSYDGDCTLFPSKDQRDWSKFTTPRCKKERFDPHTLQKFDKVLIKHDDDITWHVAMFSHLITLYNDVTNVNRLVSATIYPTTKFCVPYNDETKHLIGTNQEAPEYYRYWED